MARRYRPGLPDWPLLEPLAAAYGEATWGERCDRDGLAAVILRLTDAVLPDEAEPDEPWDEPAWQRWSARQSVRKQLLAEAYLGDPSLQNPGC